MFVPAAMSEVDIFVFDNDIQAVAHTVARLGMMHLLDVNALGKWAEGVGTEWAGRIAAYTNQERRARELLTRLGIAERYESDESSLGAEEDIASIEAELQSLEEQTRDLREQEADVESRLDHYRLLDKSLEILSPLSVSISDLRHLDYLHMVAGTIPVENLARLEASLFRIPYTIVPVHRYENRVLVFAFCSQEHAPILDRALESAFLDPLALPEGEGFSGTGQEVLTRVRSLALATEQEAQRIRDARRRLAERVAPQLLGLWTRIRRNAALAEAMAHFGHRGRVYLIAGWVPKDKVGALRKAVEDATDGRVTFEENSPFSPGRRIPTLLRNGRLLRPVQQLVSTYGMPGYEEIDPTPLVGVTFVLMFGAMFGDLGHGLMLAALGALMAWGRVAKLAQYAQLGGIMVAAGLASSVFGVLYGSVFGLEDIIPHLWLQPMHDIPTLLIASVVLGVIILNVGFICRLLTAMRGRAIRDAIFDKNGVAGLLFYWSLLGVVLSVARGKGLALWLELALIILLVALFFAEPLTNMLRKRKPLFHGGVGEGLVLAFFELFEALISYVSNTLSYVRLGAFAVAHAGLTMVVFLLANMLGAHSPTLRLMVIIFGNLVVIGFEGLIVGIQTLRLEYYELFGKFFKGEGIPFRPLTLPEFERASQPAQERSRIG